MSSFTLGSLGVHVASSHFSNINATNENNGCFMIASLSRFNCASLAMAATAFAADATAAEECVGVVGCCLRVG